MPFDLDFTCTQASGPSYDGGVSIFITQPDTLIAPALVFARAASLSGFVWDSSGGVQYLPAIHEAQYEWTVNGETIPAFTVPTNMLSQWNVPNKAYGQAVMLPLPTADTAYTITVVVRGKDGSGNPVSATASSATLTPQAKTDAFPAAQQVYYSNDGAETWAGVPVGAQTATTFSALQSAIGASSAPLCIFFKRGQTITAAEVGSSGLLANSTTEWLNGVGAWGSGARPIIECPYANSVFRILGPSNAVTFFHLDEIAFSSSWGAGTMTGVPGESPFELNTNPEDTFYTLVNFEASGLSSLLFQTRDSAFNSIAIMGADITSWQDYGVYVSNDTGNLGLLGCQIVQDVDAPNGHSFGKNGMTAQHGPIRVASSGLLYMSICDLFSRNGWSSLSPDQADQPCLRAHQSGDAGSQTTINRCVFEGGGEQIALSTESAGITENPGNHVVESCLFLATAKTWEAFGLSEYGGTTWRNNIGIQFDVPDYHTGNGWQGAIKMRSQVPGTGNLADPQRIYNNTWINLRNSTNDPGDSWPSANDTTGFTDVSDDNNILYAPNLDTPVTPGYSIDVSQVLSDITPRYKGVRYYPDDWMFEVTGAGSIANGGTVQFTYKGSADQTFWNGATSGDLDLATAVDGDATGGDVYFASDSNISVTFNATGPLLTNNSGGSWTRGTYQLKLFKAAAFPAIPSTYSQTGESVIAAKPAAVQNATTGLMARGDFFDPGLERTAETVGAIQVA